MRPTVLRLALLAASLLQLPAAMAGTATRHSYAATVTHVSDGDTVWVRPATGGKPVPVRLEGIDAPEICQSGGPEARTALQRRLLRQRVTVQVRGRDDYDRTLARVQWQGQDVGRWLVAEGLAWSARWRRAPGPYEAQQVQARQAGRGLWSQPRPIEPRTFRRQHGPCARD